MYVSSYSWCVVLSYSSCFCLFFVRFCSLFVRFCTFFVRYLFVFLSPGFLHILCVSLFHITFDTPYGLSTTVYSK